MKRLVGTVLIGMALVFTGCSNDGSDTEADASDVSDATDASDSSDASDASDAADASDSSDVSDASDTSDASDSSDVSDASDTSDASDSSDASDASDASDPSDSSDPSDTSDPSASAVFLEAISDCPQAGHFLAPGVDENYIDYNGDGQTNAENWNNSDLIPAIEVDCTNQNVEVTSNGVINFDYVIGGGGNPSPVVNEQTFRFPKNPEIAAENTALPLAGLIGVLINGVQIYGPNETIADNGADPYLHGLLGYCNGHVHSYHGHAIPDCFYNIPTLSGADSLLEDEQAGQVLGYALDGFPILAPYECVDEACTEVLPVRSGWTYDTSATWEIDAMGVTASGDCIIDDAGGFSDNYVWDCNLYVGPSDTATDLFADECNGRTRPDGTYAYYATREFPYFTGCFRGTAQISGPGGNGNGPPGN
ncbi:MAG: YHYH protein [Deltaproteobacteria bacterium]|nr:YHYH protein [Deltaproteobacteria bacterium]MBT6436203.1 YHYH protein [Deltaproteobacteria bacterium]